MSQQTTSDDASRPESASAELASPAPPSTAEPRTSDAGADSDRAPPADGKGGPRGARSVGFLALVVAVVAALGSGASWWHYRELRGSSERADAEARTALEQAQTSLAEVQSRLMSLEDGAGETRTRVDTLGRRLDTLPNRLAALERQVDALPGRLAALERRVDAVQGVSADARAQWLKARAEYYLTVANTQLDLVGNWDGAIEALELADGTLRDLGDPALGPVRERIAEELTALRAVKLPDVEGLSYRLGSLSAKARELPMRGAAPLSASARAERAVEAQPGWTRLWLAVKGALESMISVQRQDTPTPAELTAEERGLARRQLTLELQVARVALVRAQPQVFRQSVIAARDLLARDFDARAGEVASAIELLNGMLEVDIAPRAPDISGSLSLLRGRTGGAP